MIKLRINGKDLEARPGTNLLETAGAHGIYIPSLCASEYLAPYGGCRLCLVEIKGRKGYLPACCTFVEEGLDVVTETPELQALRRQTLELILSEHPHACLICTEKKNCDEYKSTIRKVGEVTGCVLCPANGDCRLQEVVEHIQAERVRFPASYRQFDIHREDPFFDRNYNLCILCGRCVRVCHEVRGASVVSIVYRGPQAVIETAFGRSLLDSGCQFCGACVDACPTGALTERASKILGVAEEKREALCPHCGVGCTLEVGLSKGKIIATVPKGGDAVNDGQACVKGRFILRDVVHNTKRLLRPMVRRHGALKEASWDEALDFVASKMGAYQEGEAAFVYSSELSLEDQYVGYKFAREIWHADAVDAGLGSSAVAAFWQELMARGIEPELNFDLNSIGQAKSILVVGTDLTISQPILWLEVLKAVRRGAHLVALNPGAPAITRHAAFSSQAKPGKELYPLARLTRLLTEIAPPGDLPEGAGYAEFERSLLESSIFGAVSAEPTEEADWRSAARLLTANHPSWILFGSDLAGRPDTSSLISVLWNLALLGNARLIPLARQVNERGSFELWRWSGRKPADKGMLAGRRKVLYLAGGLPAFCDKPSDFLVLQSCHAVDQLQLADAVLPATTPPETEGSYINLEGRIQRSKKIVEPAGEARPDWWILSQLAQRLGYKGFAYKGPAEIAEELARTVPALREVSRPTKKGRPAFVAESPRPAKGFIPLVIEPPDLGSLAESQLAFGERLADRYRGFDLVEQVRGLKRLRERSKVHHG